MFKGPEKFGAFIFGQNLGPTKKYPILAGLQSEDAAQIGSNKL
jgi:hypothetical protein